jgi:hypothetical protein
MFTGLFPFVKLVKFVVSSLSRIRMERFAGGQDQGIGTYQISVIAQDPQGLKSHVKTVRFERVEK